MSPITFYCWLQDQPVSWIGLNRWKPKQDQSYPIWIPILELALLGLGLLLISNLGWSEGLAPVLAGCALLAVVATHGVFSCLAWNQRATQLRKGRATATPDIGPRFLLGCLYLLAIDVATPLALAVVTENIRGSLAWKSVESQLIAQGERLTFDELAPPAVPPDQNFASLPTFARLFEYSRSGRGPTVWRDTNAMRSTSELALPHEFLPKRKGGRRREVSLEDWATAFRLVHSNTVSNPVKAARRQPDLPHFPVAPTDATAARTVLIALSVSDEQIRELCDASKRPYARFPVHWNEGYNALIPHVSKAKLISQQLDLRVRAHLQEGDRDAAFRDAQCSIRIGRLLKEEPLLISQLVHIAQMSLATDAIAAGLRGHQWAEPQLAEFQRAFEGTTHLQQMAWAMEGERAGAILTMNRLASGRFFANAADWHELENGNDSDLAALLPFMPRGWVRQNQTRIVRYHQTMISTVRSMATNPPTTGLSGTLRQFDNQPIEAAKAPVTPYNMIYRQLVPALEKSITRAARADQTAALVVAGCAAERFRLAHGKYPDALTELVPQFLAHVPRDLMNGQPIRYERIQDTFRVWSVGRDGTDDDGTESVTVGAPEYLGNDWVWPTQP